MTDVVDLTGLKQVVEGIGDQISTAINIDKVRGILPNQNMFDNWYFIDPINQQGFTSAVTTNLSFTIDRWHSKGLELSIQDDGFHAKYANVEGSGWIRQRTEYKNLAGRSVTVSWIVDDELYTGTAVVPDVESGAVQIYFENGMKSAVNNFETGIACSLWITDSEEHVIKAAKFEVGDRQTLAHQNENGEWILNDPTPNPGIELLKCQRYVFVAWPFSIYPGRTASTNDGWDIFIPTPIAMRTTPTFIGDTKSILIFCDKTEYATDITRLVAIENGVILGGTFTTLTRSKSISAIIVSNPIILDAAL